MKFAHQLKQLDADAPPEFRGKFLKYKQLKKIIKHRAEPRGSNLERTQSQGVWEAQFFSELDTELREVNGNFEKVALELTKRMMDGGKAGMSGLLRCFPFHKKKRFGAMNDAQLALHAHWCFQYAKANAAGLRKILKKHDKLFHTAEGQRFLQTSWGGSGRGNFLHSPLLDELQALEAAAGHRDVIASQAGLASVAEQPTAEQTANDLGAPMTSEALERHASLLLEEDMLPEGARSDQDPQAKAAPGATPVADELMRTSSSTASAEQREFRCPICLELMYRPLGLACGHKFCAPCAFKAAGMGNAVGSMRALLHYTPPLTPCPECRRPGMYAHAKELESVGQLIKFRWPQEYLERAREEIAREGELRQLAQQQKSKDRALSTLWHYC
ncbi:hypothetical protein WJX84_011566 [Apatococcus fuscideae]|uniref:RING-type E3 ubiquitin transferase n=1 Tax=Apatococcus fuscideae TaxID=2026836 RepID=A0AAW1SRZ5_9CHLO